MINRPDCIGDREEQDCIKLARANPARSFFPGIPTLPHSGMRVDTAREFHPFVSGTIEHVGRGFCIVRPFDGSPDQRIATQHLRAHLGVS